MAAEVAVGKGVSLALHEVIPAMKSRVNSIADESLYLNGLWCALDALGSMPDSILNVEAIAPGS